MKKNILSFFVCAVLLAPSCKKVTEFLDKPPGVDIDENTIFTSRVEVEKYIATLYQFGLPSPLPLRAESGVPVNANNTIGAGITDEAEASESFSHTQSWNGGSITPFNIVANEDYRYTIRWQAIRAANIILERAAQVPNGSDPFPGVTGPIPLTHIDVWTGEALFIRAINNFEMLKRYGGFPLVLKRIVNLDVESKIPRSTFEQCVNAIVKDCDDALAKLPNVMPGNFTGRAHKGAALALKARTLLYAASPLFNAVTPPVSYGSSEDNKLVVYGNYDVNRWQAAADASKAVLDWASTAGVSLIDQTNRRIPTLTGAGQAVVGNYRTAWEQPDATNTEVILANKAFGTAKGNFQFPWQHVLPRNEHVENARGFWVGTSPTFNFVRKYEKRSDGTPQTWNLAGGNDLLTKYAELDPRFMQTIVYVGARLHNAVSQVRIWEGAPSNKSTAKGGHWMLKWVPDAIGNNNTIANVPIFRLNEFYLSYAEALNEVGAAGASNAPAITTPAQLATYVSSYNYPVVPANAFDLVNKVRLRSGMPPIRNLSQAQLRQRIMNERDIELAFEDHRFNDIRRWKIAEQDGVMTGDFWGLEIRKLNEVTPFPTAFSYRPFVFERRLWRARQYYFPFDFNEVMKGSLKQNPGWEVN